jgi:hypothetical protein
LSFNLIVEALFILLFIFPNRHKKTATICCGYIFQIIFFIYPIDLGGATWQIIHSNKISIKWEMCLLRNGGEDKIFYEKIFEKYRYSECDLYGYVIGHFSDKRLEKSIDYIDY